MQAQNIRRVLAYVRVSTSEQVDNGAGLDAQRTRILAECERRGWDLIDTIEDAGYSARDLRRPGIRKALDRLEAGEADGLLVARLDRLSRSLLDFAGLTERARREGWALVCLDLAVDTSTPAGELMANVLATFAQFERRLIGERTREGMAEKRAQGVHLGRRSTLDARTVRRIRREREAGATLQEIATGLDRDQIKTGQAGKQWWPSTVAAVLRRNG